MNDTWTHGAARFLVRPLVGTGITPNHLTTLRLLTGLAACLCLAVHPMLPFWGGLLWIVSAFLDRADGELARIGGMTSPGGHRYDYLVDNGVNCLFFAAIGVGLSTSHLLGPWSILLGLWTAAALLLCNWISELYETRVGNERILSGAWGFHPDDALYLLGPAAWFGLLLPLLIAASVGTGIMAVVVLVRLLRLRSTSRQPA